MSTSGVSVNADVPLKFMQLSEGKKFRYIIFKIDDREIIVESAVAGDVQNLTVDDYAGDSKEMFEIFVDDLKSKTSENDSLDCRYAVFDFRFTISRSGAGNSKMDKILFFLWCPDGASIKKKMIYASSAYAIKSALGVGKFIAFQISDESEMNHTEILSKLRTKYGDH